MKNVHMYIIAIPDSSAGKYAKTGIVYSVTPIEARDLSATYS